jgi:hypothetical protein
MNHEIRALGELGTAFERAVMTTSPRRRRLWRWRPLALFAVVVVGGATGALAAAGVLRFGSPVHAAYGGLPKAPAAGNGVVKGSSVRLLGVRAADPGGGLPWGMRLVITTRGLGCLEVAREQDGRLGVVGQDNSFSDDGLFHPLPAALGATSPACAPLDREGQLMLNVDVGHVAASGLTASGLDVSGGCLPPDTHEPGGVFCPRRDERNLYYGLLGPQATSLTYTVDGTSHTLTPHGPDGAYLVVVRSPPDVPGSINNAISASLRPSQPITTVTYRSGLRCNFATPTARLPRACEYPPGYAAAPTPQYTDAELATPVHATVRRGVGNGWKLVLSFIARAPVTNALSSYVATLPVPTGYYGFPVTQRNIAGGTHVTFVSRLSLPLRAGVYHGTVDFTTATTPGQDPFSGQGHKILVGRFTVRVP